MYLKKNTPTCMPVCTTLFHEKLAKLYEQIIEVIWRNKFVSVTSQFDTIIKC